MRQRLIKRRIGTLIPMTLLFITKKPNNLIRRLVRLIMSIKTIPRRTLLNPSNITRPPIRRRIKVITRRNQVTKTGRRKRINIILVNSNQRRNKKLRKLGIRIRTSHIRIILSLQHRLNSPDLVHNMRHRLRTFKRADLLRRLLNLLEIMNVRIKNLIVNLRTLKRRTNSRINLTKRLILSRTLNISHVRRNLARTLIIRQLLLNIRRSRHLVRTVRHLSINTNNLRNIRHLNKSILRSITLTILRNNSTNNIVRVRIPRRIKSLHKRFTIMVFILIRLRLLVNSLSMLPQAKTSQRLLRIHITLANQGSICRQRTLLRRNRHMLRLRIGLIITLHNSQIGRQRRQDMGTTKHRSTLRQNLSIINNRNIAIQRLNTVTSHSSMFNIKSLLQFTNNRTKSRQVIKRLRHMRHLNRVPITNRQRNRKHKRQVRIATTMHRLHNSNIHSKKASLNIHHTNSSATTTRNRHTNRCHDNNLNRSNLPQMRQFLLFIR